jgi:hypothetical protein
MTFMPLTPSVGKEKRILGGQQKVNSQCAEDVPLVMVAGAIVNGRVLYDRLDRCNRPTV